MTRQRNTAAWHIQVWASFLLASLTTAIGILYLPVDAWIKAFLGMGLLFTIGSCFSLAKTIRDEHEASQVAAARVEHDRAHPFRTA
jgi:hypothetical protein